MNDKKSHGRITVEHEPQLTSEKYLTITSYLKFIQNTEQENLINTKNTKSTSYLTLTQEVIIRLLRRRERNAHFKLKFSHNTHLRESFTHKTHLGKKRSCYHCLKI